MKPQTQITHKTIAELSLIAERAAEPTSARVRAQLARLEARIKNETRIKEN